jgi:hypothetical protein
MQHYATKHPGDMCNTQLATHNCPPVFPEGTPLQVSRKIALNYRANEKKTLHIPAKTEIPM